jgi:DNA-binding MarR family transcriptional regulator
MPPTPAKPYGCTNLLLRQLMRRVARHYEAEVGKSGLKGTQYWLLSHVVKRGPLRPVDLAAEIKCDPSTLSRNLKPLLAAGWIEQVAGPDARSHLVQATPAGREKRAEAQRRWRVAQEAMNAALGSDRVIALHALIGEAMEALGDDGEGPDPLTG